MFEKWKSKSKTVSFRVPLADYQRIESAAGIREESIPAFLYRATLERVQTTKPARAPWLDALDHAFEALDQDLGYGPYILPLAPVSPPEMPRAAVREHPCIYLDPSPQPRFRGGETPGSCTKQGGKPCFFHAGNVHHCGLFRSKFTAK